MACEKFTVYEKSSGKYLGHAEFTARPAEEGELQGKDLEFVPHNVPALKMEYVEDEEEEYSDKLLIDRDLFCRQVADQIPADNEEGTLTLPMSKPLKIETSSDPNPSREVEANGVRSSEESGQDNDGGGGDRADGDRPGKLSGKLRPRKRTKARCFMCLSDHSREISNRKIKTKYLARAN